MREIREIIVVIFKVRQSLQIYVAKEANLLCQIDVNTQKGSLKENGLVFNFH